MQIYSKIEFSAYPIIEIFWGIMIFRDHIDSYNWLQDVLLSTHRYSLSIAVPLIDC